MHSWASDFLKILWFADKKQINCIHTSALVPGNVLRAVGSANFDITK